MVLVVGSPIGDYYRARERLELVLIVAGPLLIGLLAGSGWLLAGAALRPVRRLTGEADEISVNELGRRLPVPESNDEIEHLARTINAMLDRIERAVANERMFIDDASHELRTPISILRGELELALARPDDVGEVTASLHSALDETVRLGRLAEDLLALARVRSGELRLRLEAVDLRAEAERVGRSLDGAGAAIEVAGSGHAWADPDRVDQVLVNLLVNARRHAASRVEVLVHEEAGRLRAERGRRRARVPRVDAAGHLRALRPRRPGPGSRHRRHRVGPGHRGCAGPSPGRTDRGRQPHAGGRGSGADHLPRRSAGAAPGAHWARPGGSRLSWAP